MRKLKLQVQTSVDGYMGGPNGELDFMTWTWDDGLKKFVNDLHVSVDCILLGRNMAPGFIPHWANVASDPKNPEHEFGKIMHETPKVVFSQKLKLTDEAAKGWSNTVINNGDLKTEINKLKNQPGQDIIVYGGSKFVSSLVHENLIDELYLFVNPTALGTGIKVFNGTTKLKLSASTPFSCGINVLKYQPA